MEATATHCSQCFIPEDGPATELAQDRSVSTWVSSTITKNSDSIAMQSTCASEFLARASTIRVATVRQMSTARSFFTLSRRIRGNIGRTFSLCHRQATRVRESRGLRASHLPSARPRPRPLTRPLNDFPPGGARAGTSSAQHTIRIYRVRLIYSARPGKNANSFYCDKQISRFFFKNRNNKKLTDQRDRRHLAVLFENRGFPILKNREFVGCNKRLKRMKPPGPARCHMP